MVAKELIEARWKIIITLIAVVIAFPLLNLTYDYFKVSPAALQATRLEDLPEPIKLRLESYDVYVWSQWFIQSGLLILGVLAVVLGAGLIAGEVSKGTIYLLLSRPLSRDRVLLTKYSVSAAILLIMSLITSFGLMIVTASAGHPQNLGGILISSLLLWLGLLFVLGLALFFSVIFNDVLRPILLIFLIWMLLGLPGLFAGWSDWSLPGYWASLSAYLGNSFPVKEVMISLVSAVLPLLGALFLFRRQAY